MFDELQLQGSLSDLPRTSENYGRRKPRIDAAERSPECPPLVGRNRRAYLSLPPRIGSPNVFIHGWRNAKLVKDVSRQVPFHNCPQYRRSGSSISRNLWLARRLSDESLAGN